MDDTFVGPPDPRMIMIIGADFCKLEEMIMAYASAMRDGVVVIRQQFLLDSYSVQHELIDLHDWMRAVAEPATRQVYTPPSVLRTPLRIKQAPRQSFRQSMRSVNRNR